MSSTLKEMSNIFQQQERQSFLVYAESFVKSVEG